MTGLGGNAGSGPRIGLVHALYGSIVPIERAFRASWPEATLASLYDQSLYLEFDRAGRTTAYIERRIETLLRLSVEAGSGAILFTGSLFGAPVRAVAADLPVPVLTAYEAMIEDAFATAARPRLGLVATVQGTIDMMRADIESHARDNATTVEVDCRLAEGAMEALQAGDQARHDALVADTASALAGADAILLGQFSMAPVAERLGQAGIGPVLTSPGSAVAKLRRLLG